MRSHTLQTANIRSASLLILRNDPTENTLLAQKKITTCSPCPCHSLFAERCDVFCSPCMPSDRNAVAGELCVT